MKLLLDTNRYLDFCEAETNTVELCRRADRIGLPYIVLAELRAGFRCGRFASENEKTLTCFLNKPRVEVVYADDGTTHAYAQIFRQLREQGSPIPTNDLWIAALAIQHDWILCTRDRHFKHLPQIPTV